MNRESKLPMKDDTIFRIYSMTKPITSVALMQLHEKGLFQLNDPVSKYLPEFKNPEVFISGFYPNYLTKPTNKEITILDLLTHTSGLTYDFLEKSNVDYGYHEVVKEINNNYSSKLLRPQCTLKEYSKIMASLPLEFEPNEKWNCSISTDICGRLVEVLSKQKLDAYLRKNIFKPLQMEDTGFYCPKDKLTRFSSCYVRVPGSLPKLQDHGNKTSEFSRSPLFLSGGGGVLSTIHDYYIFCQMLLNKGTLKGQQIISRKTVELMTTNNLPNNNTLKNMGTKDAFSDSFYDGKGFGLGFAVTVNVSESKSLGSIRNYHWGGYANTFFWNDPMESLTCILMTQLIPSDIYPIRQQLQNMIYGAFIE